MSRQGQVDVDIVTTFFGNGREMCAPRKRKDYVGERGGALSVKKGGRVGGKTHTARYASLLVRRWSRFVSS